MYMGVAFALTTLLVLACVASIYGGISFSLLSLLSGAALFVLVCLATNYVFGYVFNVKTQPQSAVISGLILSFIFTPPSDAKDYMLIVMVATIAMASKYLLAWRGRHIFNPVAISAVIISLTGLGAASWWVATPALLIPVVLFGTFTLYRTHRIQMGYIYVLVAITVSLIVTAMQGSISETTLWMVVASYPILFLAFFMLSEPLTQAPRNWQRNSIAIGVAVIASSQFFVGTILITPELALVIGNVVAFLFGQKRAITLRFVGKTVYNNGQVAYDFQPQARLRFTAGQYIELTLPHKKADMKGIRRVFSIASGETDETLRIITRHSEPSSTFKRQLAQLTKKDMIAATGIYGDFILPKNNNQKVVLIAGGIGITPFLSHVASNVAGRDITLLYFIRDNNDAVAADELKKAIKNGVNIVYVQDQSVSQAFEQYIDDGKERIAYISGSPQFVDAAKSALKSRTKKIVTDYFTGY